MSSTDYIRVNIGKANISHTKSETATITEQRDAKILTNTDRYDSGVETFSLTKFRFPDYAPDYKDVSTGETYLQFSIEDTGSGSVSTINVIFSDSPEFFYSYQDVKKHINSELARVCGLAGVPIGDEPYFIFRDNIWKLVIKGSFKTGYNFYLNFEAFCLFDKFEFCNVSDNPINNPKFAMFCFDDMSDETFPARMSNLNNWSPVKAIVMLTDMPVNKQLLNTTSSSNSSTSIISKPILTSYPYDPQDSSCIDSLIYLANPYRWASMLKDRQFDSLTITFQW